MSGSGISWAICKSAPRTRQITTPAPHHSSFFTGRVPFLPPNQQRQSTEGTKKVSRSWIYPVLDVGFPSHGHRPQIKQFDISVVIASSNASIMHVVSITCITNPPTQLLDSLDINTLTESLLITFNDRIL